MHHRICNTNRTLTKSGQATRHADDPKRSFALRQIDQARTDFAAIESTLALSANNSRASRRDGISRGTERPIDGWDRGSWKMAALALE